ncbi:MAG: DegT/DnrJ/EryC1/StrS family aminotransferase [Pseudodesulfovibrio sp.]
MNVRLFRPDLGERELEAVRGAFDRAWLGLGPKVSEFEEKWSAFVGAPCSVATNSATAGLHLALAVWRFPRGKKVLVPGMTFAATALAPLYEGLEPVFVDCDPETLGLDLGDLERKIDKDCVAVMPVHMGGHPVPMDRLLDLCAPHGLKVVEDCAHTAGGEYKGRKLGTWGDMGVFSFEEKKCMTTGDGGMIALADPGFEEPLKAMRWMGIDKDTWKRNRLYTEAGADVRHWYYEIALLGYKYNMNDLAASIGLVQLERIHELNGARHRALLTYLERLKGLRHARPLFPYVTDGTCPYWIFGLRCDDRDGLMAHLKERGVSTGLHYSPLTAHPLFAPYACPLPNAQRLYGEMITLPLFAGIREEEIAYVCDNVSNWDKAQ